MAFIIGTIWGFLISLIVGVILSMRNSEIDKD
jgi:preprotein translocase subunit SecD